MGRRRLTDEERAEAKLRKRAYMREYAQRTASSTLGYNGGDIEAGCWEHRDTGEASFNDLHLRTQMVDVRSFLRFRT